MVQLLLKDLKERIHHKIGRKTYSSIMKKVEFKPKELWAAKKCKNFEESMVAMTLYKDLEAISFDTLRDSITSWQKLSKESLTHNVRHVRRQLRKWADGVLMPTPKARRLRLGKNCKFPTPCESVSLCVDSTDFRVTGMRTVVKKDPRWSQKLKSPGRRWMTITDAEGCVQFVPVPYDPTDYDRDIFITHRDEIERLFEGETIIGDNHFRKGQKFFKKCPVISSKSEAGQPRNCQSQETKVCLVGGGPETQLSHRWCERKS